MILPRRDEFGDWSRPWWTRRSAWNRTRLRRRFCAWRDHEPAPWGPVVVSVREADRLEDGVLVEGREFVQREYRCSRHDRRPA